MALPRATGPFRHSTARQPDHVFEVDHQRRAILRKNWIFNPAICRARYLEVGGFDVDLWGTADWECYMRLLLTGSRAGLVDAPLVHYRQRPGRLTGARVLLMEGRVNALEKALRLADRLDPEERRELDDSLRNARLRFALEALRAGDASARAAALAVVRDSSTDFRRRVRALAAAAAPRVARRVMR